MDVEAVRTVIAIADLGRFADAAAELGVTQQAVSKRVAALERELGVPLFTRTARGAALTDAGRAFLPPARELLAAAGRARSAVRPAGTLRVDVVGVRVGPGTLLRAFHRARPELPLDVLTLYDRTAAEAALRDGSADASFRAVLDPPPAGLSAGPVYPEPLELVTGPRHPLAGQPVLRPEQLAGLPIWMPGNAPGTEWATYYDRFAAAFGCRIDVDDPSSGLEPLLEVVAGSAEVSTLIGVDTRPSWPERHDLRRIPLRDPVPVYPHALLHRAGEPHPTLAALRAFLAARPAVEDPWNG